MSNNNILNPMGNHTSPLSSTYFEDLIAKITKLAQCEDCGEVDTRGFGDCLSQISSLGERAKKMLQVGALQDELIKLGFLFRKFPNSVEHSIDQLQYDNIVVTFPLEYVVIHNRLNGEDFYYNYADTELHTNVLSKVKQFKGDSK
jgi:hypothetical protein